MYLNGPAESSKAPVAGQSSAKASQLQEEIAFWQQLLSTTKTAGQSDEVVERIQQALELAQYRLGLVLPYVHH